MISGRWSSNSPTHLIHLLSRPYIIRRLNEILKCWSGQGQSCQCFLFSAGHLHAGRDGHQSQGNGGHVGWQQHGDESLMGQAESRQKGTKKVSFDHKLHPNLHLPSPASNNPPPPTCAKLKEHKCMLTENVS